MSVDTSRAKLNAIQLFKSFFELYSRDLLIAVMRHSVVCLEMGIYETTLCSAASFGSKTLNISSTIFLIHPPSPYRRFARAIFQAITKLASATLLA